MQPHRSYLVCATPRSGSTLLCEALTNTGIAGRPKEYFEALKETGRPRRPLEYFETLDSQEVRELLGQYSRIDDTPSLNVLNYADYLAQVIEEATTPNGVFGAKVMCGYFADFISYLREIPEYSTLPAPELLSTIFPKLHYIWVTRRNKARQAVSLWKAIQTQTWKADGTDGADAAGDKLQDRTLVFNFEAIDHLVKRIVVHEAEWQRYFAENGIHPLPIVYEELDAAYEETARKILHYLDIPVPDDLVFAERRMKRQADDLSEEWVRQYYSCKEAR